MYNRNVAVFLIINFILAIIIVVSLKFKQVNSSLISNPVTSNKTEQYPDKHFPAQTNTNLKPTNQSSGLSNNTNSCIVYGPMGIENKATLDTIFAKDKVEGKAVVDKRTQYEIYWSLGKDKNKAIEMFNRQKEGPLQDPKFKLTSIDETWIVSIATVSDSIDDAKKLAVQLAEKANKIKSGGNWQYRTLPDAYYYQLKDVNSLSQQSLSQINNLMDINKNPCVN